MTSRQISPCTVGKRKASLCSLWIPEAGGEVSAADARRKATVNVSVMMSVGVHALLIFAMISHAPSRVLMSGGGQSNASSAVPVFTAVQVNPQSPERLPPKVLPVTVGTPARSPLPVSERGTVALPAMKKIPHASEKPSRAVRAAHSTGKSVAVTRPRVAGRTQPVSVQRRPPGVTKPRLASRAMSDGASLENIARVPPENAGTGNTATTRAGAGEHPHATVKALTRRVNYPQRAKALGVEGRVKLRFDVTADGTVTHVRITEENPAGVFSGGLYKDIARWRYQKGAAAENQTVTIIFKLSGAVALAD